MRIGFAADTYKPYISGVTNYIQLHKAELERRGHEVTLFTFGAARDLPAEPRVIYSPGFRLKMGYAFGVRYSRAALEELRQMDIVHLHHPFITGYLVSRECKPRGIPMVFTGHTRYDQYFHDLAPWMPEKLGIGLLSTYLPKFCRQMDRVISNSDASSEGLRNCGVDVKLCTLPNGVNLQPFQSARRDDDLRKRLAGDKRMLFLYVGRLAAEKNLGLLFTSFTELCRKYPSSCLVLVGTGPMENRLREQVAGSAAAGNIHFTGLVPYHLLPSYFASADAFVMPSLHDTHPLTVIEAMAAGLPLVVVNSPAYHGTVIDGDNGIFCQNEAASFQAGLEKLLVDQELRIAMGNCSRELSEQFSVQRTAGRLLDLYAEILAERQAA